MDRHVFLQHSTSLLPTHVLTNAEMTERLSVRSPTGVPPEVHTHFRQRATLTERKTGIRERHFFDAHDDVTQVGVRLAAQLSAQGLDWSSVDGLLVASSSIHGFPGLSQRLVAELRVAHPELGHPFVLDVTSNACTSFLYAVGLGISLIRSFAYNTVVCIAIETASRCISDDIRNFGTSTLFGDAAAAMVLSSERGFARVVDVRMGSRVTAETIELIQGSGALAAHPELAVPEANRWKVAGPRVAGQAVQLLVDEIQHYLTQGDAIDWLIPHQANRRGIMLPACERTGFPSARMLSTIEFAANTSTASVPLTFDHYHQRHVFSPGECILLVSFGASFTIASVMLEML